MKFLADENFHGPLLKAIKKSLPKVHLVRIQDLGMSGWDDPSILEWAGINGFILLTHDVNTMTMYAHKRIAASLPVPGVFIVNKTIKFQLVIEDMELIVECGIDEDWLDRVTHIPFWKPKPK